jgi:hypothetical protein
MTPVGSKFSDFPPANPALPVDLIGLQGGINVRTTLINPVCEDANGLVEVTSVSCTDVTTVTLEVETINGAAPVTVATIDALIAAYLAAHP